MRMPMVGAGLKNGVADAWQSQAGVRSVIEVQFPLARIVNENGPYLWIGTMCLVNQSY